jgi:lipopolysaccharide export system permease protein
MPILIRYCLVQLIAPFFLSVFITTFVLDLMFYLLDFINLLFINQIGILNSLRLLLYVQPSLLVLSLPIAFLAALLIVFGRLSSDREMMALESMGFSPGLLLWPLVVGGGLFSVFLVFFMNTLLPWGNVSYLKLYYNIVEERSAIGIKPRVFNSDFNGLILYVDQKDEKNDTLRKVMIQFVDDAGRPNRIILAPEGRIRRDPRTEHVLLELQNGILQQTGDADKSANDGTTKAKLMNMQFEVCTLDLDFKRQRKGLMDFKSSARNMTLSELSAALKKARAEKRGPDEIRDMEAEYHKKFSIPFSALAFALIGIPLGLLSRAGSFLGTFLAVMLVGVYWLFVILAETFVAKGVMSGFLAWWLPNFFLMAIGVALVWLLYVKKIRLVFLEGIRCVRTNKMQGKEAATLAD